jgi:hypothetical protein
MGSGLPKEQAKSERTKLCPIKANVYMKTCELSLLKSVHEKVSWFESEILIHRSVLSVSYSSVQREVQINENFLILLQDQGKLEVSFLLDDTNEVYFLRLLHFRQFKDVVQALFVSKRPSWILSPVCQNCSRSFNVTIRNHHCRNCGKHICGQCSEFTSLEISGYLGQQRVCSGCLGTVLSLTKKILNLREKRPDAVSGDLYYFNDRDSILGSSLKSCN